jgi:alkaline phosphatase D
LINEHNFGLINISGPRNGRNLDIQIRSTSGKKLWSYQIAEKDF